MRPIGFSDKLFYYTASGRTLTCDMKMRISLVNPPNKDALRRAARKTLKAFPEFAVRPVIHNRKFFYEDNDADIAIFDDNGELHSLGSDETNGYLLCLICGERHVILSFYHGLSDFVGNWSFICTLIYRYAQELGYDIAPAEVMRLNAAAYLNMSEIERDDPYSKFGDVTAVPTWTYKSSGAFHVPEKNFPPEVDRVKNFDIETTVADMLAITKRFQTSFTPLLICAVSRALKKIYDTDDKPIVVKMPVNMRPIFKTATLANFSDSAILTYTNDFDDLSIADCCRALKDTLKAQMTPENFARTLVKKKRLILDCETSGKDPAQIREELAAKPSSRPITFAVTYPGILELPTEYKAVVRSFNMEPAVPIEGFFMFVGAYDDNQLLRIRCCQRFDSDKIARAVASELEGLGFNIKLKDGGSQIGDKVYIDKIRRI